jgi:hypothetical protein
MIQSVSYAPVGINVNNGLFCGGMKMKSKSILLHDVCYDGLYVGSLNAGIISVDFDNTAAAPV